MIAFFTQYHNQIGIFKSLNTAIGIFFIGFNGTMKPAYKLAVGIGVYNRKSAWKVLWPNPIKDTAYEKKEAPKLKHISRSELKRMTEIPMPDLMMELVRRVFILPR